MIFQTWIPFQKSRSLLGLNDHEEKTLDKKTTYNTKLSLAIKRSLVANADREFSTFRHSQQNNFITWSYSDLSQAVQRICRLLEENSKEGDRICFLISHPGFAYATILACIFGNRIFVPMSLRQPSKRHRDILTLTESSLVLTDNALLEKVRNLQDIEYVNVLNVDDGGAFYPARSIRTKSHLMSYVPNENIPAYIIFTSGSTGIPKGVVVGHANIFAYLTALMEVFDVDSSDRMTQCFELNFDSGLGEFFYGILCGASLHPFQAVEVPFIKKYFDRVKPSIWGSTPSLLQMIRRNSFLKESNEGVRLSLLMGERLTSEAARFWHEMFPSSRIFNLYGPTETTINVLFHEWKKSDRDLRYGVPLGKPLGRNIIKLIDREDRPVSKSEVGEILIGGDQVSLGYLNNPQKTTESFSRIKLDKSDNIWYRSGDFAFYEEEILHFVGREDNQVKLRGFRLELNEIEFQVRQKIPSVNAIAFIQIKQEEQILSLAVDLGLSNDQIKDLLAHLKGTLPTYAIPESIFYIPDWPTTSTGKTDRPRIADETLKQSAQCIFKRGE